MNEVLKRALAEAGITEQDVAARLGVDSKTVRHWLEGRRPYPRNRSELARLLGIDQAAIWHGDAPAPPQEGAAQVEASYAHRWAVPCEVWQWLFGQAEEEIGILGHSGLFLAEDEEIPRILAEKARAGVAVRIALGDPDSPQAAKHGADEAEIRDALAVYLPLGEVDGVELRLHETPLYASLYRGDDDLLVNPHAYGVAASHAPVLHVRRTGPGDMAGLYAESFEHVWRLARPVS